MRGVEIGALCVALLAPALARAQDASGPPPKAPEGQTSDPQTDAPLDSGASGEKPPRWMASVAVRQSWDSNPTFSETQIQGSWLTGLNGRLAYANQFSRGSLTFAGDGGYVGYSSANGLDEWVYSGQTIASWKASPRLVLGLDQSYSSQYTHQNQALIESGLVLPQTIVHRLGTTVSAAQRLAERTSLTGLVRFEHVTFPNSTLLSGNEFTVGAGLTRQLNRSDNLSVAYSYLNDTVPAQPGVTEQTSDIHTLTLGWSRRLAEKMTATASGGLATFTAFGTGTRAWEPQGAASIERKTRHFTMGANYAHSVGQAYGLGRQRVADVIGASIGIKVSRTVSADAVYNRSWNKDPADSTYSFDDDAVSTDLRWTVFRRLGLAGSYSYRRSTGQAGTSGALTGSVYGLSMSYGQEWR
jgi:hypothetical protein